MASPASHYRKAQDLIAQHSAQVDAIRNYADTAPRHRSTFGNVEAVLGRLTGQAAQTAAIAQVHATLFAGGAAFLASKDGLYPTAANELADALTEADDGADIDSPIPYVFVGQTAEEKVAAEEAAVAGMDGSDGAPYVDPRTSRERLLTVAHELGVPPSAAEKLVDAYFPLSR